MPDLPPLVALLLPLPRVLVLALLLTALSELWPFLVPFVASALAFLTGYISSRITSRRAEAQNAGKETANEKKAWRDARLLAEKTNADNISKEHADRIFWQLENAADWERVVGILKEFGEVQRQLAVVASTSQHHATEIQRLNAQITEMNKHLNDFIMRHVRPASA